ncbi:MAG TPA: hypothetical protein VLH39_04385, partial [Magnetospirillaceae bacterium]|nr:hypothetical protein [Magnetospirillaceae bacterium]
SGLSLIVANDLYLRAVPQAGGKHLLRISRAFILAALAVSALFSLGSLGGTILSLGFLSMGLRAAVLLVPLLTALFCPAG